MSEGTTIGAYYDAFTPYYKYVYADWDASVKRQAAALDGVIREYFGDEARRVLDAACGIGTQAIGLAELGYAVTASDLSAAEIDRARIEADRFGVSIEFGVADMRNLGSMAHQPFDVVIACDNAIPHLLSDDDILAAFRQFHEHARLGCIISVRDYAAMDLTGHQFYPRQVHQVGETRLVLFDVWDFDGDYYDMTTYAIEHTGDRITTHAMRGRYYCVTIARLVQLMTQAGFVYVVTMRDRFFQPLIVGMKESSSEDRR